MLTQAVGRVTRHVRDGRGAQVLQVLVPPDREGQALNYVDLTGEAFVGDQVLLNTTAQTLRLGTGGYDFVIANLERRIWWNDASSGHIIKGRYLPCQHAVLTLEEQDEYAGVWDKTLDGFPVLVGQLHSQIAPVAAALTLRGKRVAYVMTDAAALPMAFSRLVQELKDAELLAATFTCGQAWGGDYETVTLHSALLAAKYVAGCDAAVVCQGPGNAGTGTRTGFSGIEQAHNMDIAVALGGLPVAIVRMSEGDLRARHRGFSHHTRTTLELVRSRVRVALPVGSDVPDAVAARHEILYADETQTALNLLAERGIKVTTMGRTPAQDPAFFLAASAAGMLA